MITHTLTAVAALFLSSDPTWTEVYQQYQSAVQSGDVVASREYALAAWEAAEQQLPPGENRALLAQNAGFALFSSDPGKAVAPLNDAVALARQGYGLANGSAELLTFLRDVGEVYATPERQRRFDAALESLATVGEVDLQSFDARMGRLFLAELLVVGNKTEDARVTALSLGRDMVADETANSQLFERLTPIISIATLQKIPGPKIIAREAPNRLSGMRISEFLEEVEEAMYVLRSARRAYPLQESIATFDKRLATLMAWEATLSSVFDTLREGPERRKIALPNVPVLASQGPTCTGGFEWKNERVRFPRGRPKTNGAAIAGFDLADDGSLTNVRILAEVPGDTFSEATVKGLERSTIKLESVPPECRKDLLVTYSFSVLRGY